jgi:ferredoxin
MRIVVDHDLCSGHGRCAAVASQVYVLDENGFSAVNELDVPAHLHEAAQAGANNCPERAITVIEG